MRRIALALASLALIGAGPQDEEERGETVTIRAEWIGWGVCTGLCRKYQFDVSRGWVIGFSAIHGLKPVRLRLDPAQYRRFRDRMAAFRPADMHDNARRCAKIEFGGMTEVIWYRDNEPAVRRVSCPEDDDRAFDCAVYMALIDLGIHPLGGTPLARRDVDAVRATMKEFGRCA
ncbi:hypothetical protein [Sphingomonas caeni]|uniref:hypothetical protein n=1 Tax=Sphingomonas caeni TaxID=2984949 RepID=UPI002230C3C2|nr:hypothetical protein [Sphingomonas caeni]